MKTRLSAVVATACVLACGLSAAAQVEVGLNLGTSGYRGDIQPTGYLDNISILGASYGGFLRFGVSDRFAARAYVQKSHVAGDDALRTGAESRNLSFRTDVFEVGAMADVFVLGRDRAIAPYISAGASVYTFNPETEYNGQWVELQPLGTEGQGLPGFAPKYELTRLAVPLALGVTYALGDSWLIGAEASARMLFFDHFDDVSGKYVNFYDLLDGGEIPGATGNGLLAATLADRTNELRNLPPRDIPTGSQNRGNPSANDWYYTATITVSYRIGSGLFNSGGTNRNSSRYNRCYQF